MDRYEAVDGPLQRLADHYEAVDGPLQRLADRYKVLVYFQTPDPRNPNQFARIHVVFVVSLEFRRPPRSSSLDAFLNKQQNIWNFNTKTGSPPNDL